MAKLTPIRGDYVILGFKKYPVFVIDKDGDIWIEKVEKLNIREVLPVQGHMLIGQDYENQNTYFCDDTIARIELEKFYTYLPDYMYEYKRIRLTKLTKILYSLEDEFNGDLFLAVKL